MTTNGVSVAPARATAAQAIGAAFQPGVRTVLTTHVNADGDGVGSAVALWHLLAARGVTAAIAIPTGIPERFAFLVPDGGGADVSDRATKEVERAGLVVVLDIGDLGRLGDLGPAVQRRGVPVVCIDHHVSPGSLPPGPRLIDPTATATAELVYDLAIALDWEISRPIAQALYVGILMDTGGFRFANTTPRILRIAAELLEKGVDPETIYEKVYATASEGRIRLAGEVLQTLVVEPDIGLAWVTVPPAALERHSATADDLEGLVEYPRSVSGVRLALLFRQIASGRIKVSFRSVGDVDVAALAQNFGGGGHKRAAGASFVGTLADVQQQVLAAARDYLR